MTTSRFELVSNPLHDIYPTLLDQESFALMIAYVRSAEALSLNEYNQDAFAVWSNNRRFIATIADGVGQSFRGDISAMAVVQAISRFLWEHDLASHTFIDTLSRELTVLSPKVQELLRSIDISHHPAMFRDALELRRQLGSESVFASCAIDFQSESVYIYWLGDCRIRLFDRQEQPITLDSQLFRTTERWSSQRTLVGDIHHMCFPLAKVGRIFMYSDGLHLLDYHPVLPLNPHQVVEEAVAKSLTRPESDDITLVMIDIAKVISVG